MHGVAAPAAKDAAWRKSKNAAGSCSWLLQLASCKSLCRHQVTDTFRDRQRTMQARKTHHKHGVESTTRRSCHEFLSFDRKDCQSREQPAVDEISEKNTSPNAGIPLFPVASGISLRQREAFVVCRATTTISQHQHGNRCGFQVVATFLIEPTRARCASNSETAGYKGQGQSGVQQTADRIEVGRGGGRSTSGLGSIVVGWARGNCGWARENGRGPK